jgi:hypothetical protein
MDEIVRRRVTILASVSSTSSTDAAAAGAGSGDADAGEASSAAGRWQYSDAEACLGVLVDSVIQSIAHAGPIEPAAASHAAAVAVAKMLGLQALLAGTRGDASVVDAAAPGSEDAAARIHAVAGAAFVALKARARNAGSAAFERVEGRLRLPSALFKTDRAAAAGGSASSYHSDKPKHRHHHHHKQPTHKGPPESASRVARVGGPLPLPLPLE